MERYIRYFRTTEVTVITFCGNFIVQRYCTARMLLVLLHCTASTIIKRLGTLFVPCMFGHVSFLFSLGMASYFMVICKNGACGNELCPKIHYTYMFGKRNSCVTRNYIEKDVSTL